MIWFKKKKSKEKVENPYENFEVVFHQKEEIHRQYQYIEEIASRLKDTYNTPRIVEFIDDLCSLEKVFVEGRVRGWSNEKIREVLIERYKEEVISMKEMDEKVVQEIHKNIHLFSDTVTKIDEVAKKLSEKYRNNPSCIAFISYVRDVYVAYIQSTEQEQAGKSFKDYFVEIRMEIISCRNNSVDISDLRDIYREFRTFLEN